MEEENNKSGGVKYTVAGFIVLMIVLLFLKSWISENVNTYSNMIPILAEGENENSFVSIDGLYARNSDGFDYIDVDMLFGSRNKENPVAFSEMYGVRVYENGVEQVILKTLDNYNEKLSNSSGKARYFCLDKDNSGDEVNLYDVEIMYGVNNVNSDFKVEVYDLQNGNIVISKNMKASMDYYDN
ncbi:MAG: hypothetical protein ACI4VF_09290 [Lachnospirales bacterium]